MTNLESATSKCKFEFDCENYTQKIYIIQVNSADLQYTTKLLVH